MDVIRASEEMTRWSLGAPGRRGFVPTMGSLHRGHTSLMDALRPQVDRLIASIYVNPLQFGPEEDLDSYPRDLEADLRACHEAGVDAVFAPADLYPEGFQTSVRVQQLAKGLCSDQRPVFFAGIATAVARLFGITRCDVAAFGEKDFQQLRVIQRMVRDLALPVEVIGCPLIRDEDGLALSSRNAYLSSSERRRARTVSAALFAMARALAAGERNAAALIRRGRSLLDVDRLHYLEVRDARSLQPVAQVQQEARALIAAQMGRTRLIDNLALVP